MAALNGTALLLYSEGVCIAMQKGISITVETDLPDATNKESAGWAQHIFGMRNSKIDFTALFSSPNVPDMSGKALMEYILSRESLLVSVLGLSFPIVAEADLNSLSIDAPLEGVMTLSGSLKVKGALYALTGANANLITNPEGTGETYDTFTHSDTAITSAIISAGPGAYAQSDSFSVTTGDVIKLAVFLTKNSGVMPIARIREIGGATADISNTSQLVEGLNIATLTVTATKTASLLLNNGADAANWSTSPIYLFKV
jgi:hypothetical protein